jgi:hypothetical protein
MLPGRQRERLSPAACFEAAMPGVSAIHALRCPPRRAMMIRGVSATPPARERRAHRAAGMLAYSVALTARAARYYAEQPCLRGARSTPDWRTL